MTRIEKAKGEARAGIIARLRELCPPGTRIHAQILYVARSGMARDASFKVAALDDNGRPYIVDLDWHLIQLGIGREGKDGRGVRFTGCGYSATFEGVYQLGRILYPDGFGCIGEGCPSNDHSNGDLDWTPHGVELDDGTTAEHWHGRDGGYALRCD